MNRKRKFFNKIGRDVCICIIYGILAILFVSFLLGRYEDGVREKVEELATYTANEFFDDMDRTLENVFLFDITMTKDADRYENLDIFAKEMIKHFPKITSIYLAKDDKVSQLYTCDEKNSRELGDAIETTEEGIPFGIIINKNNDVVVYRVENIYLVNENDERVRWGNVCIETDLAINVENNIRKIFDEGISREYAYEVYTLIDGKKYEVSSFEKEKLIKPEVVEYERNGITLVAKLAPTDGWVVMNARTLTFRIVTAFYLILSILTIVVFHGMDNREKRKKEIQDKAEHILNSIQELSKRVSSMSMLNMANIDENDIYKINQNSKLIQEDVNDVFKMLDNVAKISEFEAGKELVNNTKYYTYLVYRDIINQLREKVGEKSLIFNYEINEEIPFVQFGDSVLIKRMVDKIVDASLLLTSKGSIKFGISSTIDNHKKIASIEFILEDTGKVLNENEQMEIYEVYNSQNEEVYKNTRQYALNLVIAKRMAELQDGNLVIESNSVKGNKYVLTITQKIVDIRRTTKSLIKENLDSPSFDFLKQKKKEVYKKKALIILNSKVTMSSLVEGLKVFNINAERTFSAKAAKEALMSQEFDIVFIDSNIFEKYELLELIEKLKRDNRQSKNIKKVLLVSTLTIDDDERPDTVFFDESIIKPIDTSELERIFEKFF